MANDAQPSGGIVSARTVTCKKPTLKKNSITQIGLSVKGKGGELASSLQRRKAAARSSLLYGRPETPLPLQ